MNLWGLYILLWLIMLFYFYWIIIILLNGENKAVACFGVLASMKTEYLLRQAHPVRGTARRERCVPLYCIIDSVRII